MAWRLQYSTRPRLPAPRSLGSYNAGRHGNGGQVSGNLPAIATHAGIEPAPCTWRWQAGGGEVYLIREGGCPLLGQIRSQI